MVGVGVGDLAEPDELVGGEVLVGVLRGTYVDAHPATQPSGLGTCNRIRRPTR